MSWTAEIILANKTGAEVKVQVRKGQVFSNKKVGTGYQNVAASRDYTFSLPPYTKQMETIEVLCINEKLKPPTGFLNVSPYRINKDFLSQQDLWEIMRTNH